VIKKRAILGLLLFLPSCFNIRPHYDRPTIEMGEEWRFPPENITEYVNIAWWEQFQDPVLTEYIQIALKNNQNLMVATATVLQFYDQYRVASSQLYPQIFTQDNYDRIKNSNAILGGVSPPGFRIYNLFTLLLNMSYEVDVWGAIRNTSEAAWDNYLAQIEARRTVVLTLVTSVAAAYIQLKEYDTQLEISKRTYDIWVESWNIALAQYNVGLVSEMEVKQAESQAESAEIQIKNYEILVAQQEDLISVLLGEAPTNIKRSVPLVDLVLPAAIPSGLPSDILLSRPDVVQAELQIQAANAQIGVARASFLPAFTITGNQGQKTTNTAQFLNAAASYFDYDVQLFQEVFTGGRLVYTLKQDEALKEEAVHTYLQTILTALQEVDDALISFEKNQEILVIQKEYVDALQIYYQLSLLRYNNGQNDYLTVLNAETSLFTAQLSLAQTQGTIFISLINLYKALGQGWEVDPGPIDPTPTIFPFP
jgi:multidrug efflux system outer membrane protein